MLGLTDHIARLLGCEDRAGILARMLQRHHAESTGYWLQLVVAACIATLGLALGSTAVIIGAMLIAPLMQPIIESAMGLAVGSPLLVLRGAGRILVSVIAVIVCSGALTLALPFHEATSEILARASPTALDLLIAAFCALAGVYATVRPAHDVASTAAGTSIGISLVPPLCASGFGLGTRAFGIAGGAALLFLANLAAILALGTLCFSAIGFPRVDVIGLEERALQSTAVGGLVLRLRKFFGTRGSWVLRIVMPLALLATIYLPLRRALTEVTWQIEARAAVREALARLTFTVLDSRVQVESGSLDVVVFMVGTATDAASVSADLERELAPVSQKRPRIEVHALPDADAYGALRSSLGEAPPPPAKPRVTAAAPAVFQRSWPAGIPYALRIEGDVVTVSHVGPPLDVIGKNALQSALSNATSDPVVLSDAPIDPYLDVTGPVDLFRVGEAVHAVAPIEAIWTCVEVTEDDLGQALRASLEDHPRTLIQTGAHTRVTFETHCPTTADAGTD